MTLYYLGSQTLDFGIVPSGRKKYLSLKFTIADDESGTPPPGTTTRLQLVPSSQFPPYVLEVSSGWTWTGTLLQSYAFSVPRGGAKNFEVFVSIHSTSEGPVPTGSFSVRVSSAGSTSTVKTVKAYAQIGPSPAAEVALVLDRSSSMASLTASGTTKSAAMRSVTLSCLELLNDPDRVALLGFNESTSSIVALGPLNGTVGGVVRRTRITQVLQDGSSTSPLHPVAATSLPAAVTGAQTALAAATHKQAVFLSDGTNDVGDTNSLPSVGEKRYVVGIGGLSTSSYTHLANVANGNGPLLWDGSVGQFELEKYVSQVLLGATGAQVVLDPVGDVSGDTAHVFDFDVTEADYDYDVIAFTDSPDLLQLRVDPDMGLAQWMDRSKASDAAPLLEAVNESDKEYDLKLCKLFERLKSPDCSVEDQQDPNRLGHRVRRFRVTLGAELERRPERMVIRVTAPRAVEDRPVRYTLLVSAHTDLALDAQLHSSDLYVGADLLLSAVLTQFGKRLTEAVNVDCELSYPDGDVQRHTLLQQLPGRFTLSIPTFRPGCYKARFIATGSSAFGRRFRREMLATALLLPASGRCPAPLSAGAPTFPPRDKSSQ